MFRAAITTALILALSALSGAQTGEVKLLGIDIEPIESAVPDLAAIVVLCAVPDEPTSLPFLRLMVIEQETGEQVGVIQLGPAPMGVALASPCEPRTVEHILLARNIGTLSAMCFNSDLLIIESPLTFDHTLGQIAFGEWFEHPVLDDVCETGKMTAVCEMTAAENPLGEWRLWIGTENGFLLEVERSPSSGQLTIIGRYPVVQPPTPVHPVSQIGLIPQNGYYALGVRFGDGIRGMRVLAGGAPQQEFHLHPPEPGTEALPYFDHFVPPQPISPTQLVFVNPLGGVSRSSIPSDASGDLTLDLVWSIPPTDNNGAFGMVFSGSLLMLTADSSGVFYDPWFSDSTELSACYVEVSNGSSGECIWCCDTAGDADNTGSTNIGDVTFLVAHIFSGGGAPICQDEGDADGNNSITIGDVTYLVALIFSGGLAPICGTTGT